MDIRIKIVDQCAPSLKQDIFRLIVKKLVGNVLKSNRLGKISFI